MDNYRKWEKWAHDNKSDSEEDMFSDDDGVPFQPQVTRFDQPTSVTFGGGAPSPQFTPLPLRARVAPPTAPADPQPPAAVPEAFLRNGGYGGGTWGVEGSFVWSQTQRDVTLRIAVPAGTRSRDVVVRLTADDDFAALAGPLATAPKCSSFLDVQYQKKWGIQSPLAYAVLPPDGETGVDWELEDWPGDSARRRFVVVHLNKASPDHQLITWWSRVLPQDPEIDVTLIADRKPEQKAADVWNEAQRLFNERAKPEPQVIDADDDDAPSAYPSFPEPQTFSHLLPDGGTFTTPANHPNTPPDVAVSGATPTAPMEQC